MAGRRVIECVGPSYQLADRKSAVQRSVNLYLSEIEGLGEARPVVLRSAPGLVTHLDLGATVRGHYSDGERHFVAAGSTLYEIVSGVAVSRGALATSSGYVDLKRGRDQLVVVDGANGYVLDLTTTDFSLITDPDWRGSRFADELDGYFIFVPANSDQFYISAIDDAESFDALDFTSADANPDDIVRHAVLHSEIVLFGTRSIEFWVNSGGADFPFVRYNAVPVDVGIVGARAMVKAADSLYFVGQTSTGRGFVYVLNGHQPVRVSTKAVEEALQASGTDLSECTMWAYATDGAEFIGINAPGMTTTWVYDAASKQWHERAGLDAGDWTQYPADLVVSHDGTAYAAWETELRRVDDETYDLCGDHLVRERTWPHLISPAYEPVSYRSLELQCTTGNNGSVTLETSNDGGYVWSAPRVKSLGATGRRMQRVRWMPLGSATDRVFRLRCSDAVPFNIHGAQVDAG